MVLVLTLLTQFASWSEPEEDSLQKTKNGQRKDRENENRARRTLRAREFHHGLNSLHDLQAVVDAREDREPSQSFSVHHRDVAEDLQVVALNE